MTTLQVDATLRGVPLADVATHIREAERNGFAGAFVTETNSNPFLPLALAAADTDRIEIGTGIALAFPRSPMDIAYTAWDLQALSGGRFVLGLGSQVRAHVERRFGNVWSHPARRMAEYVRALRAIWSAWEDGTPLEFEGEFSRHTLMPPEFRPAPQPHGAPPVLLAAVRSRMVQVAGEHADGLLVHPLHTPLYLHETVWPALERGFERGDRRRGDFQVSAAVFLATNDDEREAIRRRVAFYGSTPGYRDVLEAHGWGDLHRRLHALSRSGDWDRMAGLVDDEVLETFCIHGHDGATIREELHRRYEPGTVDRINVHGGDRSNLEGWAPLAAAV